MEYHRNACMNADGGIDYMTVASLGPGGQPPPFTLTASPSLVMIFSPHGLATMVDIPSRRPYLERGGFSMLTKARVFLEFSFKDPLHKPALPLLGLFVIDNPQAFPFNQKHHSWWWARWS